MLVISTAIQKLFGILENYLFLLSISAPELVVLTINFILWYISLSVKLSQTYTANPKHGI